MKLKCVLAVSTVLFLVSGCSGVTKPMTPAVKKTVHAVALQEKIEKPKSIYYLGPEVTPSFMLGGPVGVAIAAHATQKDAANIRKIARDNHIKIQKIVRNEIIQAFKQSPIRLADNAQAADAQLKISITKYGVTIPQGFSSSLAPVLYTQADLIKNNNIIWSYTYHSHAFDSELPAYTLDEIREDPKNLNYMYTMAAKQFAEGVIREIN